MMICHTGVNSFCHDDRPCIELNAYECKESVACGTKFLSKALNTATSIAGMTSLLGRCHTFDRRADGYCRGEGCGAFLLTSGHVTAAVDIFETAVQ